MVESDFALRRLVVAILPGDGEEVSRLLRAAPQLARASFHQERHDCRQSHSFSIK